MVYFTPLPHSVVLAVIRTSQSLNVTLPGLSSFKIWRSKYGSTPEKTVFKVTTIKIFIFILCALVFSLLACVRERVLDCLKREPQTTESSHVDTGT